MCWDKIKKKQEKGKRRRRRRRRGKGKWEKKEKHKAVMSMFSNLYLSILSSLFIYFIEHV